MCTVQYNLVRICDFTSGPLEAHICLVWARWRLAALHESEQSLKFYILNQFLFQKLIFYSLTEVLRTVVILLIDKKKSKKNFYLFSHHITQ